MRPTIPWRSSWLRMSDTVADTTAHGSSRWSRELATAMAALHVGAATAQPNVGTGDERGEEVGLHERRARRSRRR